MNSLRAEKTGCSGDGHELKMFTWGTHGPDILIVNAVGSPMELVEPLAMYLAQNCHRVHSWESRGYPGALPTNPQSITISSHAMDLDAVVSANQLSQISVISFCSGAPVALKYLRAKSNVSKLVFIAPTFAHSKAQSSATQFWKSVELQNDESLALTRKVMATVSHSSENRDSTVTELINRHLNENSLCRRYARVIHEFGSITVPEGVDALRSSLGVSSLCLLARDDEVCPSQFVLSMLPPDMNREVYDHGGHYFIHENSSCFARIRVFFEEQPLASTG